MKTKYFEELKPKLIYVFRINDEAHKGCLKIGEATMDVDIDKVDITKIEANSDVMNDAAKSRIDQYTMTAGIAYELLYTESASYRPGSAIIGFNDKDVHNVLRRSGIERKKFDGVKKGCTEWYVTDLETIKCAIKAVKEGRESLKANEISNELSPIQFRPEQAKAIDKTVKLFTKAGEKSSCMLWNAKMRFGKTLAALQVVKNMHFSRTLILTHRPVVDAGWFEDFGKIFYDTKDYVYGSKKNGMPFKNFESLQDKEGMHYVYFASMQDLRGSETIGGKFDKNNEVFSMPWDFIIIDEAHEGTQTSLGKAVIEELTKKSTKVLQLSGTPFNLMDDVDEERMFTWDYTMEQRAKEEWDRNHFSEPNPYAGLPRMNIYTYDLGRLMSDFSDEDVAFNFKEFFRTNEKGEFVHSGNVLDFLNLLTKGDPNSMYPFANAKYRNIFRHTLWMVPGVKAAKALSTMLKEHPVFGKFEIVNVAGEGDEEEAHEEALAKVNNAIANAAHGTITLSCGRLTTGVSVKQWMGVLMLSGSYNTAASAYMQTIFRVQTPYSVNGLVKENCYVFDFAPDRTLQVLASVPRVSTRAGQTTETQRQALGDFLNFCPVIGIEGSVMKPYDANTMMEQLKKVYVERVVRNGFEDGYLYNDELLKLDDLAIKDFNELKGIIGQTKAIGDSGSIDINSQGLTDEEYEEKKDIEKKKKTERTEKEKARLEDLRKKRKVRQDAISILRGISIRMPLLIYGADIENEDEQLTIDNFTSLIDAQSWEEFMPRGVTKATFGKFKKYYDPDIFSAAGKRIRAMARAADRLTIEERVERITQIFSTFRNPDKETILTPWRVVNMHMSDTIGGYTFFNEDFTKTISEPRYVDRTRVTDEVFSPYSHLLEINSKSGLYPLYLAYNLYRRVVKGKMYPPQTLEDHLRIWDTVVAKNLYVICKTPMAKAITRRTLMGFRKGDANLWAPENLINIIKNKPNLFIKKVLKLIGNNVEINAIVGNPPYQEIGGSGGTNDAPIYQYFCDIAFKIPSKYNSFIIPARWFSGGRENLLGDFRKKMLSCGKVQSLFAYPDGRELFQSVEIKGGLCYFLIDNDHKGTCHYVLYRNKEKTVADIDLGVFDIIIREPKLHSIVEKVDSVRRESGTSTVDKIISADTPFGIPTNPGKSTKTPFDIFDEETPEHNTVVYYLDKGKRVTAFVRKSDIKKNAQDIHRPKVFVPGAGGSGNDPHVLGKPVVFPANSVCSQTFLYSAFDNEYEALSFRKYLTTKFLRILVSAVKITQHVQNNAYRFVPMQDFTRESDIDWTESVANIDRQLYKKYDLTADEIDFIESMIKPM